ncbi:MAG TPA: ATP-binding protein [Egibacteraceae bacterium]|nr:ATP-binding protein [Egibacteraceae bacterium]
MLRRGSIVLPLVAASAAVLGALLPGRAWLAALLAVAGGLVAGVALNRVAHRRIERVADLVEGFAVGEIDRRVRADGSASWRRLVRALDALGASFARQLDQLGEERARVERLLEQLPLAVLLFTEHGLAYANPTARELFDLGGGGGGAMPLQVLGVPALADAVAEVGETGRTVEVEVTREDRILAARAAEPTAGEVALVVTDLTEARRVEEIRRDFVVNASHELKTPAAGMRALADSIELAVDRDPPRARRMITRLREEADRLAEMVRDLLDLARLEEAAAQRGRQPVDVAAAVRRQLGRFEALAAERGITLACACPEPATVVAQPEDIRLIVDNLVENAVRYNRDGGRVDVFVRRADGQVVVEVADTGLGIPAGDRDRIFERFYRVDKARTRAAGGTGLGLSLVRNAVARHGGAVSVDSVVGQGSVFRVVLPVEGATANGGPALR